MFNVKKYIFALMFIGLSLSSIQTNMNAVITRKENYIARYIALNLGEIARIKIRLNGINNEDAKRTTGLPLITGQECLCSYRFIMANKLLEKTLNMSLQTILPNPQQTPEIIRNFSREIIDEIQRDPTIETSNKNKIAEEILSKYNILFQEAFKTNPIILQALVTTLHDLNAAPEDETIIKRFITQGKEWILSIGNDEFKNELIQQIQNIEKQYPN